jgi:hypothetical protein
MVAANLFLAGRFRKGRSQIRETFETIEEMPGGGSCDLSGYFCVQCSLVLSTTVTQIACPVHDFFHHFDQK